MALLITKKCINCDMCAIGYKLVNNHIHKHLCY